jgi:hypothetical protein
MVGIHKQVDQRKQPANTGVGREIPEAGFIKSRRSFLTAVAVAPFFTSFAPAVSMFAQDAAPAATQTKPDLAAMRGRVVIMKGRSAEEKSAIKAAFGTKDSPYDVMALMDFSDGTTRTVSCKVSLTAQSDITVSVKAAKDSSKAAVRFSEKTEDLEVPLTGAANWAGAGKIEVLAQKSGTSVYGPKELKIYILCTENNSVKGVELQADLPKFTVASSPVSL